MGSAIASALLPSLPHTIDERFLENARGAVVRDAAVARREAASALVEAADAVAAEAVAIVSALLTELTAAVSIPPTGPPPAASASAATTSTGTASASAPPIPSPEALEAMAVRCGCEALASTRPSFVGSLVNLAARGDLRRRGALGLLWHESVGRRERLVRSLRAELLELLAETRKM
jgi:hypothetical protein